MTQASENAKARQVRGMFGRIAGRYDLLNRLMTAGQDPRWRREAIDHLELGPASRVADLGCGTADIALEISRRYPDATVVASDFTPEMLAVGRQRPGAERLLWVQADARYLPFASEAFDGVISGFLLRNVPNLEQSLAEQHRTLQPGGRMVSLDTTPPHDNWYRPLLEIHFKYIIPLLGRLIAGDPDAYVYLPDSTMHFKTAENLAARLQAAGFAGVGFVRRMFGTIGIHWGVKN